MFYFTYGSNMDHQQMEKRCPSSHYIKKFFSKIISLFMMVILKHEIVPLLM